VYLQTNPSWDNWISYKRSNAQCQKILRKEKKSGWHNLCASFNYKTPMMEIWPFVKAFKAKTLAPVPSSSDMETLKAVQESALNKLCPPSYSYLRYPSLKNLTREDILSSSPCAWMDDPFSPQELDASIAACKVNSSLGWINLIAS